jgi:hypothetical protein
MATTRDAGTGATAIGAGSELGLEPERERPILLDADADASAGAAIAGEAEAIAGADGAGDADADAAVDDVLSRPEVAERVNRRVELHTRQLVRLFRRAQDGDEAALARLMDSREGRQLWQEHQERLRQAAAEQARQDAVRLLAYRDLMQLRDRDPATYARYMSTREWRQFANEIEEQYGDQLPHLIGMMTDGAGTGTGGDGHQTGVTAVGRGPSPASAPAPAARGNGRFDVDLDALFERLKGRPTAKYLTARDWEELDPVNYADMDPGEAAAAMADRYAELVVKRRQQAPPAQARAQREAVRRAVAESPPPMPTGSWLEQLDDDAQAIIDAYLADPKTYRKQYEELIRKRHGWQPAR